MRLTISGIVPLLLVGCLYYVASDEIEPMKQKCGIHEKYNECGTYWYCERTCDQPEGAACPKICVPGCFCKSDYIRKHANDTCIKTEDCGSGC